MSDRAMARRTFTAAQFVVGAPAVLLLFCGHMFTDDDPRCMIICWTVFGMLTGLVFLLARAKKVLERGPEP